MSGSIASDALVAVARKVGVCPADLGAVEVALLHQRHLIVPAARGEADALEDDRGDDFVAHGVRRGRGRAVAVEAQEALEREHGIPTAVVSLISWELFEQQPAHYREEVLSPGSLRVGIEAGSDFGWRRWLREDGHFIGVGDQFGASAPAEQLYEHFGITKAAIVQSVLDRL